MSEPTPLPGAPEERTSVLEVLAFVWSYWRTVPWRAAGMVIPALVSLPANRLRPSRECRMW